ncbi:iron chelate uptake ABC transporter family permease subunit [Vibrio lentus]|nr:iron chelate uptake ABC transporter family permease subunit [Vibrio lentus]
MRGGIGWRDQLCWFGCATLILRLVAIGTDNRYLLPLSAVAGAALLVFADICARTLLDSAELPWV